jgi:protein O-GlcNAc transferase
MNLHAELEKGVDYHRAQKLDLAQQTYTGILRVDPRHPEALHLLGVIAYQSGLCDRAIDLISRAIEIAPHYPAYHNNLANAYSQKGNYDGALMCYEAALRLKPGYAEALYGQGNAHQALKDSRSAMACYRRALDSKPDFHQASNNLGVALFADGRFSEASYFFEKAVRLKPDYLEGYINLGDTYNEQGRLDAAGDCYNKAVELGVNSAEVFVKLANIFQNQGQLDQAIALFNKALQLNPELWEVYYSLGNVYGKSGQTKKAIECYRSAIQLNPDHAYTLNLLIRQLQQTCAWSEMPEFTARLNLMTKAALQNGQKAAGMPILTLSLWDDPEVNYRVTKSWAEDISSRTTTYAPLIDSQPASSFDGRRRAISRITIGYLSADFHNHATLHLMGSLFQYHDRNDFKIVAYSYGKNDRSSYRKKIERDCDEFVDLNDLNDWEAARVIHDGGVDILVDLKGYTEDNRLEICAFRPAPIQVSWLGFPGTTGADFIDYIITDKIVTPPEHARYFSEKFVYMPHTYQVNDRHQKIADRNYSRRDFGLPDDAFVFCSFNEPYKIEPVMFDVWMRILQRVPNSALWLLRKGRFVEELLTKAAGCKDVVSGQLIFSDKLPKGEHLARMRLADLALDTRVYNGHTTTSDSLWAGVPVITLQGNHFASRVSASLLAAVGLPELIARKLEDYEAMAVRMARSPDELSAVKAKLVKNRLIKPLFDTARFTTDLETAYKNMWQIHLNGEAPRQIQVSADK